ncbi:MAG: hypothetical protein R3190_02715, partial [Thermoanaerobaculia bacterium]|nr:hypothetical protein [Thermoanaerobaculia bacterium]
MRSVATVTGVLLACLLAAAVAGQQASPAGGAEAGPGGDLVETEPIRCFWRTGASAVRVGEPFDVVLTCSVVETEAVRVVATTEALEPSTVTLLPFEVIGGTRHEDLVDGVRRYFQFVYRVRLLAEDLIGTEAELPPLDVAYTVQSSIGGGVEGMERR